MLFLRSPFVVPHLCSFSRMVKFLLVSPIKVACQSKHLILQIAPDLSSGLSLPLTIVSKRRKVNMGLCNKIL